MGGVAVTGHPQERRLPELLGHFAHNRQALVCNLELAGTRRKVKAGKGGAEQPYGVIENSGGSHGLDSVRELLDKGGGSHERRGAAIHHVNEGGRIGEATCNRLGLVGESQPTLERAPVLDLAAQRGEETGPVLSVGLRKSIESGLEHFDPFEVDLAEGAEPPAAVGQGRHDQPIGVAEFSCASGRLKEVLPERWDTALALCGAE